MKKSKHSIMLFGTFLVVIIIASAVLAVNIKNDIKSKSNKRSTEVSHNEEDTENSMVYDESPIETIEEDEYTILLLGSARPQNGEIIVQDAAKLGVDEIEKAYNIDTKGYSVEMVFLDGIVTDTGTWSGHVIVSDNEKYEFLVDGKDGNIELIN